MAEERFASRSEEEISKIRTELSSKNTQKSNKKAAGILRAYLIEKHQPSNFETFDTIRLNEVLGHFYMDLRKSNGEKYKVTSLENIRHSLNRYLQAPPYKRNIDLIKGVEFRESNINFRAVLAELKREGKGFVQHHEVISDKDLQRIYNSIHLSTQTPTGLLQKVQFDIRLYFFRRGAENMHNMTVDTFCVKTDPNTGLKYVSKRIDELSKNHRESDKENNSGGYMPQIIGDEKCPVLSYENYISHLNRNCKRLWQRPREAFSVDDEVWFCNAPIGEKTLGTFMTKLSQLCDLSTTYTNHSIRATGATLLSRSQYGAAQIMSVTGHKSVSSLAVYQRVSDMEKMAMGHTIGQHVKRSAQCLPALPAPPARLCLPPSTLPAPAVPVQSALTNDDALSAQSPVPLPMMPLPALPAAAPSLSTTLRTCTNSMASEVVTPRVAPPVTHSPAETSSATVLPDVSEDEASELSAVEVPATVDGNSASTLSSAVVNVSEDEAHALQPFMQDIMCDFSDLPEVPCFQSRKVSQSNAFTAQGMFSGCRIGNITININK